MAGKLDRADNVTDLSRRRPPSSEDRPSRGTRAALKRRLETSGEPLNADAHRHIGSTELRSSGTLLRYHRIDCGKPIVRQSTLSNLAVLCALAVVAVPGIGMAKPGAAPDPDRCLKDDANYVGSENRQVFRVTIFNRCAARFRCDVHTNVSTPLGNSLGHALINVPRSSPKKISQVTHIFATKGGSPFSAQELKNCVAR